MRPASFTLFPARPLPMSAAAAEPLWLEWLALAGLFTFATWLLGTQGVWQLLLRSDPTGITLIIVLIFAGATLWCGGRARELTKQRVALERALSTAGAGAASWAAECWAAEYWAARQQRTADEAAPLDLLLERAHGPHGVAWWVNGVQLKLGLLGKVIGFSVLALQIGQIQSFDAAQSQELLKSLTAGLGIALLTTMVGLVVAVTHATDRLCWPGTARPQPPGPSSTNSYHETLPARSLNLYRCRTKIA